MLQLLNSWFGLKQEINLPVRNIHPQHYDTVLISHANCPDGCASAWLLLRRYPQAYVHFANERDFNKDTKMPQLAGRHIILADWCYPTPILQRLLAIASKLTILDHHATSEPWCNEARRLGADVHFDVLRCGAELCAEYVNYTPWFLQHIRDRDLWLWEHPASKAFSAAFFDDGIRLSTLDKYEYETPSTVYDRGRVLIAHEEWALARMQRCTQLCTINGHAAAIVQSPTWGSELANVLLQNSEIAIACVITWDFRTSQWRVSLRSRPNEVNVATICEQFNGGGHPQAAGFTTSNLNFAVLTARI